MVWLPDTDDVQSIDAELTLTFEKKEDPISPPWIKFPDLLALARARPPTGMGDADKYGATIKKAVAHFHLLAKHHSLNNDNKRPVL